MKFGIIGAMDLETEHLIQAMSRSDSKVIAGMTFYEGCIHEVECVVVTSGVGKVNAAACAQILISEFNVNRLINTGISGALNDALDVGDIVISTDCMEHDVDVSAFGYPPGVIPRLSSSVFIADQGLIEKAYSSSVSSVLDQKTFKGRIVSGDQFVSSKEKKEFLVETFQAYTTEMEGAAIAHVAFLNEIPFVIIRSMSDKADGSAHITYDEFAIKAAKHSSEIVLKMIESYESSL